MTKTAFVNIVKVTRGETDSEFEINIRFEIIPDRDGNVFSLPMSAFDGQSWFVKYWQTVSLPATGDLFSLSLTKSKQDLCFESDFHYETVQNGVVVKTNSADRYKIRFGFVSV